MARHTTLSTNAMLHRAVGALVAISLGVTAVPAAAYQLGNWSSVVKQAQGQTVYWAAWAGDASVNAYIDWVSEQMAARYDINVVHVKVSDAAQAVARVVAEKATGNVEQGSIDLIWINGENFAAMKRNDLLYGPWAERLPNFSLTAPDDNPEVRHDFTVPVKGLESPWGKAQIVFYYDSTRVESPPRTMQALFQWAKDHPGHFTYPLVPNFLGTTFLKQALLSLVDDTDPLYQPVSEADFEAVTAPLWNYLDKLHPYLWRSGETFPKSGPEMRQLMASGQLSLAFTFSPLGPAAWTKNYLLPPSTRTYVLKNGTLGNIHFVAIPFNAQHKAGAIVLANFLLSPKAQARKQNIEYWGDLTVLDMDALSATEQQSFKELEPSPTASPLDAFEHTLPEPHPSWTPKLEAAWLERYGAG